MKKYLSIENIIRGAIIIALIAFASLKYDFVNVILGLLIVFGMTLLGSSIVRLYQGYQTYLKKKEWLLSKNKTILYIVLIITITVIFLLLLTPTLKIYSFLIVGVILFVLLIYDLIKRLL